jgi:hypothetical protein
MSDRGHFAAGTGVTLYDYTEHATSDGQGLLSNDLPNVYLEDGGRI